MIQEYEVRIADYCKVKKGYCTLQIVKVEDVFRNKISLLRLLFKPLDIQFSSIQNTIMSLIILSIIEQSSNGILKTTANIHFQNLNLLF